MSRERTIMVVVLVLFTLMGAGFWQMYQNSLNNDFNDISRTEVERVGIEFTGLYHRPSCPNMKKVGSYTVFDKYPEAEKNNEQAKAEGYKPCPRCKPAE